MRGTLRACSCVSAATRLVAHHLRAASYAGAVSWKAGASCSRLPAIDRLKTKQQRPSVWKEATIAAMRAKWGQNDVLGDVRVEVEPSEWVGLTWFRDRARRALTVYMNKYVEEAVAQHAPEIAREKNAITTRLKSGEARDMWRRREPRGCGAPQGVRTEV